MLSDLIKALQIFLKYGDLKYPTICEHDELYVLVEANLVSREDIADLALLGFHVNSNGTFSSYKYGSA